MTDRPVAQRSDHVLGAVFRERTAACADGAQVGQGLTMLWCDVDLALKRVIGSAGVIALYRRSLHLARLEHDWLGADVRSDAEHPFTRALERQFADRTADAARAAGGELFDQFDRLLVSLIGESLSQRLLQAILPPDSTVPPAQKVPR